MIVGSGPSGQDLDQRCKERQAKYCNLGSGGLFLPRKANTASCVFGVLLHSAVL